jgi:hypothetical protein
MEKRVYAVDIDEKYFIFHFCALTMSLTSSYPEAFLKGASASFSIRTLD